MRVEVPTIVTSRRPRRAISRSRIRSRQSLCCSIQLQRSRHRRGVDGRLDWREWEAQDGTKRQAVEIIADSVQFLGSRGEGEAQFVPAGAAQEADFTPAATDDDIPF